MRGLLEVLLLLLLLLLLLPVLGAAGVSVAMPLAPRTIELSVLFA